ncbi:putative myosin [Gregarina niphandrodes]|uniref:Myosin n=1 Tax=Gregarina niphandrodes TaxID=110365 RepID=A0A023B287_GRENI|nr:putative myosin [Gregarina niphandrodes]EZG51589.1 putative myosin [Gregarina niphandrodes]|eukprot:XP_011131949.1 putative myosin [Gregarina niphandrodes]
MTLSPICKKRSAPGEEEEDWPSGPSTKFEPGTSVWVKESPFALAKLIGTQGKTAVAEMTGSGEQRSMPLDSLVRADERFDLPDCAELRCLNYPNVLENLCVRFDLARQREEYRGRIYTYAGWTLLCINPYCAAPRLYGENVCEQYFKKPMGREPPHPFAVASSAFEKLVLDRRSQYVLVSGESGGGKTECSKHVLRYLTWVTRRNRRLRGRLSLDGQRSDAAEGLAALLIAANPVLEFFGNAKTLRNDNSSRFGKLFKIYYDTQGERLMSAELETYLLAKSRVVDVPSNEENYHIFYSLLNHDDYGPALFQQDHDTFTSTFLGREDSSYYGEPNCPFHLERLIHALNEFDVPSNTQLKIYKLLVGILYLGQVEFIHAPSTSPAYASALGSSTLGASGLGSTRAGGVGAKLGIGGEPIISLVDRTPMHKAMRLWDMDNPAEAADLLIEVLTTKKIRETTKHLNCREAHTLLSSLCKGLYEHIFSYVVHMIKDKLYRSSVAFDHFGVTEAQNRGVQNRGALDRSAQDRSAQDRGDYDLGLERDRAVQDEQPCVGVLDLFGFENMVNGFEQLCINYANEELQRQFLDTVILNEIDIYRAEGIVDAEAVDCFQNYKAPSALSLFVGQPSVFSLLEDACQLQQSDEYFCRGVRELLASAHSSGTVHKKRKMPVCARDSFTINHYAEPVTYESQGFVLRNQDYLSSDLQQFLELNDFIKSLFTHSTLPLGTTGGTIAAVAPATVGSTAVGSTGVGCTAVGGTGMGSTGIGNAIVSGHTIVNGPPSRIGNRKFVATISQTFQKQMKRLMTSMSQVECYFIKCIKPNNLQKPFTMDRNKVHWQLVTAGIGHSLNVMSMGYPCRMSCASVWERFKHILQPGSLDSPNDFAELVLRYLDIDDYKIGASRVFFKFGAYQKIETLLLSLTTENKKADFIHNILKFRKRWLLHRIFSAGYCAVLVMEKVQLLRRKKRCSKISRELILYYNQVYLPRRQTKAVVVIQQWLIDSGFIRLWHLRRLRSILLLQYWWRDRVLENRLRVLHTILEKKAACKVIYSVLLGYMYQRNRTNTTERIAAVIIQSRIRGYITRKRLEKLAKIFQSSAARKIQRLLRKLVSLETDERKQLRRRIIETRRPCSTPVRGSTPLARSGLTPLAAARTPIRDGSPEFGTCRSRRMAIQAANEEYQRTKEFWELKAADDPNQKSEYMRRRRSLFADTCAAPRLPHAAISKVLRGEKPEISRVANSQPITPLKFQRRHQRELSLSQVVPQITEQIELKCRELSTQRLNRASSTHSRRAAHISNQLFTQSSNQLSDHLSSQLSNQLSNCSEDFGFIDKLTSHSSVNGASQPSLRPQLSSRPHSSGVQPSFSRPDGGQDRPSSSAMKLGELADLHGPAELHRQTELYKPAPDRFSVCSVASVRSDYRDPTAAREEGPERRRQTRDSVLDSVREMTHSIVSRRSLKERGDDARQSMNDPGLQNSGLQNSGLQNSGAVASFVPYPDVPYHDSSYHMNVEGHENRFDGRRLGPSDLNVTPVSGTTPGTTPMVRQYHVDSSSSSRQSGFGETKRCNGSSSGSSPVSPGNAGFETAREEPGKRGFKMPSAFVGLIAKFQRSGSERESCSEATSRQQPVCDQAMSPPTKGHFNEYSKEKTTQAERTNEQTNEWTNEWTSEMADSSFWTLRDKRARTAVSTTADDNDEKLYGGASNRDTTKRVTGNRGIDSKDAVNGGADEDGSRGSSQLSSTGCRYFSGSDHLADGAVVEGPLFDGASVAVAKNRFSFGMEGERGSEVDKWLAHDSLGTSGDAGMLENSDGWRGFESGRGCKKESRLVPDYVLSRDWENEIGLASRVEAAGGLDRAGRSEISLNDEEPMGLVSEAIEEEIRSRLDCLSSSATSTNLRSGLPTTDKKPVDGMPVGGVPAGGISMGAMSAGGVPVGGRIGGGLPSPSSFGVDKLPAVQDDWGSNADVKGRPSRVRTSIRAWRAADDETPMLRRNDLSQEIIITKTELPSSNDVATPLFGKPQPGVVRNGGGKKQFSLNAALQDLETVQFDKNKQPAVRLQTLLRKSKENLIRLPKASGERKGNFWRSLTFLFLVVRAYKDSRGLVRLLD